MRRISIPAMIFFSTVVFVATSARAQDVSYGDASTGDRIREKTSEIYETARQRSYFLTDRSFSVTSTCGTEITAFALDKSVRRFVMINCTGHGKQTGEFYFEDGKPIFAYITFEFFEEFAEIEMWRNFKGLAGWESRYYFVDDVLKFHSHKGRSAISPNEDGGKIRNAAYNVLRFINSTTSNAAQMR